MIAYKEQGIVKDAFYHYDTSRTVEHETAMLKAAGFYEACGFEKAKDTSPMFITTLWT